MKAVRTISIIAIAATALALTGLTANAQMSIELKLPHSSYLQYEAIEAKVTFHNETDQPIVIGGVGGKVTLDLKVKKGDPLPIKRASKGLIAKNILVVAGEKKTISVRLTDHFIMQEQAQYDIQAILKFNKTHLPSSVVPIDVVPGMELSRMRRAVPGTSDQIRVFVLKYWQRNNREHLFLHIYEEDDELSLGVYDLGAVRRMIAPKMTANISGKVTIKHQADNTNFLYSSFQSEKEGIIFLGQTVSTASSSKTR